MGNNSVPKFIFPLFMFPVYRGSVLGKFYCISLLFPLPLQFIYLLVIIVRININYFICVYNAQVYVLCKVEALSYCRL